MGIFSRFKNEGEDDSKGNAVPSTLPETVIDKIGFGSVNQQIAKPVPKTLEPTVMSSNHNVDNVANDSKKIPSDILEGVGVAKQRTPHQEIRYVSQGFAGNSESQTAVHPGANQNPVLQSSKSGSVLSEEAILKAMELIQKHNAEMIESEKPVHHKSSFFANLEKFLSNKKGAIHDLSSKDIINKMRNYHSSKKEGHHFFLHEDDIQHRFAEKLDELKDLESEWIGRQKELESVEMHLLDKEVQIEEKLEELRKIMDSGNKFKLFQNNAPTGKEFILENGVVLKSIQELLYYLPQMPDNVFFHHVNDTKNDFCDWIKIVFSSNELSNHLWGSKSRQDMLERFKSY